MCKSARVSGVAGMSGLNQLGASNLRQRKYGQDGISHCPNPQPPATAPGLGGSGITGFLSTWTIKVNSLALDTKLGWRRRDTKVKPSHCPATSQWSLGRGFLQVCCLISVQAFFFFFLVKTHSPYPWPRRPFFNSPHKLSLLFQLKFSLAILRADSSLSWNEV